MAANRLRKNVQRLKKWRIRAGVECYRVYDADLPEYAAAIDVYQEVDGARRLFLHVQEYAAPASIPEGMCGGGVMNCLLRYARCLMCRWLRWL